MSINIMKKAKSYFEVLRKKGGRRRELTLNTTKQITPKGV